MGEWPEELGWYKRSGLGRWKRWNVFGSHLLPHWEHATGILVAGSVLYHLLVWMVGTRLCL